ncbi:Membrane-associated tyrosine- and threonine-specific cdc2-inhibitory kinase [Vanrija pseudolonga]|uniref:Membrane-associated tyrosine- and threonine-specific cdc2-inhibitory kinase n=1 Tax=Vanrija pseudolonga TaxID=143232 RepID=A0AAF0YDJ4_9TREE|nr:Membrane-associated tyrosine- and threonine-specific cdc2-inhibitory kinase [Vanrija pseudolonga]
MPYDTMTSMAESSMAASATTIRPRKPLSASHRPTTWYLGAQGPRSGAGALGADLYTPVEQKSPNPFHAPPTSFRSPHSSIKGKHKLSPSPSPRAGMAYEFSSPVSRPALAALTPNRQSDSSSSPGAESPTPAIPPSKLHLADDDSPIRHVPGHSRSLAAARNRSGVDLFSPEPPASPTLRHHSKSDMDDSPTANKILSAQRHHHAPPTPLFQSLRASQSQDCNPWKQPRNNSSRIPRLSISHPIRPRSGSLAQKKAVSLGDIQVDKMEDSPFGTAFMHARKARSSLGPAPVGFSGRERRRASGEQSISRSVGHKSGLSLSLSAGLVSMPDFATSNSSISSASSSSITPPPSAESLFENVKPNPEVFEAAASGIKQKFKPRDSTGSLPGAEEDRAKMPPPSVLRINTAPKVEYSVKRARSLGNRPIETPIEAPTDLASKFDFVVEGVSSFAFGKNDDKLTMPDTPVKKQAFGGRSSGRIQMSLSHPVLGTQQEVVYNEPMPSLSAPSPTPSSARKSPSVPQLTITATSSPDSAMDTDEQSPTVPLGSARKANGEPTRLGILRRISSTIGSSDCSEDESTPTKGGGEGKILTQASTLTTPTPSPKAPTSHNAAPVQVQKDGLVPRLSLPTFGQSKSHKRLSHRQSHPLAPPSNLPDEEDIFESRFVSMQPLGKGAFSTVLQVRERHGEGIFAVKRTRGVFDGVKARLRHLEEVDILRHLSNPPNPHVIHFVDAWEQNRQLFIQTEACVGSLAAFLAVFGEEHERLDEGRVWKLVRDLSDGINHIHSHGVIHFDIKPDNILVGADKSLKIADFGLATRWPRISPAEIIAGSGLAGSVGTIIKEEKLEREGDRVYMPPEELRGVFVMAADIFSFGLVVLESAMNIYLPDGGPSWHALRDNNFAWLDLSPLSPALADLIVNCLQAVPEARPTIAQVVEHPVVQRSYTGGAALAPEDPSWLISVLGGGGFAPSPRATIGSIDIEGDVVME